MDFGFDRILLILLNSIIIGTLIVILILKRQELNKFLNISFLLIISGGIGNLIDRIFRGYVIDYIDVNQIVSFPVFNFADICIVIGVILLAYIILIDIVKQEKDKNEEV